MTNPNRTHIAAVLDRSGSMESLAADTIGGFNKFLAEQKAVPGEATLTLVLFDDKYEVPFRNVDIQKVPDLTPASYSARGYTALYDALGKTINTTGEYLASLPEGDRPGAVIVLVMTDGEENSSREFGGENGRMRVQAMVKHQTETYGWTFVFMGANIDAKAAGAALGVAAAHSINYTADSAGTSAAYEAMSSGTKCVRDATRGGHSLESVKFVDDPDAVLGGSASSNLK